VCWYELGESSYAQPPCVNRTVCGGVEFALALCPYHRIGPFLVAGITDFFDGEIARRYQTVTNFGKLMDPLVDKIMIAAAFISLVPLRAIPAWAATVVVGRDFLITGLRLMAAQRGRC
jgi:Phosphatidylglycerophosphate synthase